MNYELYIARKIVSGKQTGSVSRPIVIIAISGVALGIAVIILSISIVTGFQREIRDKVIGFGSHIQISNFDANHNYESTPIEKDQTFLPQIRNLPGVKHVQAFANKFGIIKTDEFFEGAVVKGIGSDFDWSFFQSKIVEGKIFQVNDSTRLKSTVISRALAQKLKIKLGDKMLMFFIQNGTQTVMDFHVEGIYETGIAELDGKFILADINQIVRLNGWETNEVGGFEVAINDFSELNRMTKKVNDLVGFNYAHLLKVKSIRERYEQIFDWLGLADINAVVIIVLMLLVAGINMISALLIIILERTVTIGILKAVGATDFSVRKVFIYIAVYLIGIGMIVGNIIGIGGSWLQQHYKIIGLDQSSYYIPYVPVNLNLFHLLVENSATLIVCVAMMIIPSLLVTRISPVKAMRFN